MNKKTEWVVDVNHLTRNVTIKEDTVNQTPIAQIASPVYNGNWMDNPRWLSSAMKKAGFVASAPAMYNALLEVKKVMDLEDGTPDMDKLYDTVKEALILADQYNEKAEY